MLERPIVRAESTLVADKGCGILILYDTCIVHWFVFDTWAYK